MNKITSNNIFLLDGLGAVGSTIFTGLILPRFSQQIGMEPIDLHRLATVPFIYSLYSFLCFKFRSKTKPGFLLAIILANVFYCFVTLSIIFFSNLTIVGKTLFLLEILIILIVVAIELKIYRQK